MVNFLSVNMFSFNSSKVNIKNFDRRLYMKILQVLSQKSDEIDWHATTPMLLYYICIILYNYSVSNRELRLHWWKEHNKTLNNNILKSRTRTDMIFTLLYRRRFSEKISTVRLWNFVELKRYCLPKVKNIFNFLHFDQYFLKIYYIL